MVTFLSFSQVNAQKAQITEEIENLQWGAKVKIIPNGKTGPYIDNADFRITTGLSSGKLSSDNDRDRIWVNVMFGRHSGFHTYKYEGTNYDIKKDLEGRGYRGIKSVTYRVTVSGYPSKVGTLGVKDGDNKGIEVPLNKILNNKEALDFKIKIESFEILEYSISETDINDIKNLLGENKKKEKEELVKTAKAVESDNAVTKSEFLDPLNEIDHYIETESKKRESLEGAKKETYNQWEKGNYIEGSRSLVNEYARQGNASGAYTTAAIGIAAQGASIISDISANKRAREAEEAAYYFEYDKGTETYKTGSYQEAYKWFYESYQKDKLKEDSEIMIGALLLEGKGTQQDIQTAFSIFRKHIPKNEGTSNGGGKQSLSYHFIGLAYLKGIGVSQDFNKAYEMFKKSYELDSYSSARDTYWAENKIYMGVLSHFVKGEKSEISAFWNYLNRPSQFGVAQYFLGKAQMNGAGEKKSEKKAIKSFIIATEYGTLQAYDEALKLIKNSDELSNNDKQRFSKQLEKAKNNRTYHSGLKRNILIDEILNVIKI